MELVINTDCTVASQFALSTALLTSCRGIVHLRNVGVPQAHLCHVLVAEEVVYYLIPTRRT